MRTRHGKTLVIALATTAGLAVAGGIALKLLSERKGENALQYVPADAMMVMSFDTAPSARQALTMQNISKALERERLDKKFDETIAGMLAEHPLANELRANLGTSYAMAMWTNDKKAPEMAGFFAVRDRARVEELVRQGAAKDTPVKLNVMGDYLVATDSQNTFQKILDVKEGKLPSVLTNKEYVRCRETLPKDANLLLYTDYSRAMDMAGAAAQPGGKEMDSYFQMGFGMSLTLESEGMAMDFTSLPRPGSKAQDQANMLKPLNATEVNRIPAGAYGISAMEAVGPLLVDSIKMFSATPELSGIMKDFEEETNLNFETDLAPALGGTFTFGFYPGATNESEDVDFFVRSTGDGEAAARVGEKLREAISGETSLKSVEMEGAKVWETGSLGQGKSDSVMDKKTMFLAETSDGLTLASSRPLLESILNNTKPLNTDASMTTFLRSETKENSMILVINHGRMLTRFEKDLSKSMGKSSITFDDVLQSFGGADGALTMTYRKEDDRIMGRFFIPMNYDRLITLIGKSMRGSEAKQQALRQETMPDSMDLK